jgi:ribosome-associated toxin RatA of RatAB toxin-antitoxin module
VVREAEDVDAELAPQFIPWCGKARRREEREKG